jgi:hypothetical protein
VNTLNKKLSELIRIDQAIAPVDIDTDRTSNYFSMANYRQALAVLTTAALADTKNATIQLLQATNSAGAGSKALSSVVTDIASGSEALTIQVEAKAEDMDLANGFTHIAVKVTTDNGAAVNGAAVLIRGDGRYGTDQS